MDEVFVVTGGGSGIGRAVAGALPKEATVIITGRTLAKLQHTADALNAQGYHAIPLTWGPRTFFRTFGYAA
jgi:NAD(P)-dependent dehydrogenase (short-subunit alcohol dehydrogenase family)